MFKKFYNLFYMILNKVFFRFVANTINSILYSNYHIIWWNWREKYKRVHIAKTTHLCWNALLNVNSGECKFW